MAEKRLFGAESEGSKDVGLVMLGSTAVTDP